MSILACRANYDRSAESRFNAQDDEQPPRSRSPSPGASKKSGRGSPPPGEDDTSNLNILEFVAALVRIAHARYRDPSITERLDKLLGVLRANPCFEAVDDEISRRMEQSIELEEVFTKHEQALKAAFRRAAAMPIHGAAEAHATKTKDTSHKQLEVSLDQWLDFLHECAHSFSCRQTSI